MTGYLRRPADTAAVLVDGWLRTGDLGHLDREGWLTLVGRKKDLVIRGGENIYPSEVEAAILATNLVAEAAVVGQPDAVMGEVPVAFVAVAAGGNVDALLPELQAPVDQALARIQRPVTYPFLDSLPRNPIGHLPQPAQRRCRQN